MIHRVEFDLDARGHGKVFLGDHDMSGAVAAAAIHVDPQAAGGVTVEIGMRPGRFAAAFAGARVTVDDATVEALLALGWTPPPDEPVEDGAAP